MELRGGPRRKEPEDAALYNTFVDDGGAGDDVVVVFDWN